MSIDEQHVALPKLYGAPAYARPPRSVEDTPRPVHPDDLPITAFQTDEERELADALHARPYSSVRHEESKHVAGAELRPRPFRLRALGRLIRG